jgi:hypothetical protein
LVDHHKHPGLGHLARSVSRVKVALSIVSLVSQLSPFRVGVGWFIWEVLLSIYWNNTWLYTNKQQDTATIQNTFNFICSLPKIYPNIRRNFLQIFNLLPYKFGRPAVSLRVRGATREHRFLYHSLLFLSIQKPEQHEPYIKKYQKINQAVEHFLFFTKFTFYDRERKKRRKCFKPGERCGEGGEPPRVTFDFEPDWLDAKGLPNSKCLALPTA